MSAALGEPVRSLEPADVADNGKKSGFAGHDSTCLITTAAGATYEVKLYSAIAPELASQFFDQQAQGANPLDGVGDKASGGPGLGSAFVLKTAQALLVTRSDPLPPDLETQLEKAKESGDTTSFDSILKTFYGDGPLNIATLMSTHLTGEQSGIS